MVVGLTSRAKGSTTARWFASVKLVAALLIVVGLTMSVPPSFGTAEGDHFGLLLHPLFPHVHGSAAAFSLSDDHATAPGEAEWPTASPELRDQLPGIRGQAADESFRSSLSGIVLPSLLLAAMLQLRQLRSTDRRLVEQPWRAPPAPPPRLIPLAS